MLKTMPSPKGTNRERLYVNPVAAYDSAEGLDLNAVQRLRIFLSGKLSEEDAQKADAIMGYEKESEAPPRTAQDQRNRFDAMFPNARRIGQVY